MRPLSVGGAAGVRLRLAGVVPLLWSVRCCSNDGGGHIVQVERVHDLDAAIKCGTYALCKHRKCSKACVREPAIASGDRL